MRERIHQLLFERRDIASLVVFRFFFGLLMAHDALRYVYLGWVDSHYIEPQITFRFVGLMWVPMAPGPLMYAIHGVMLAGGVGIALGAYYRVSATLYFLAHTYVFLVAAEYYLNHAYLISIIALLMVFIPAHHAASLDVMRRPGLLRTVVERWAYWLLIGTLGVVYVYGAIAKMNADWIAGEPTRHWLADRADTAWGPIAAFLASEAAVDLVVWGGIAFDLLITPALLWRRTRVLAVAASLLFHLSNNYLFSIGVFPWFMLASTVLFLEPDWPRKLADVGDRLSKLIDTLGAHDEPDGDRSHARVKWLMGAYFAYMLLMPLRNHLYPGDVAWTEEGHNFSWRMKLRNKDGHFTLRVRDKNSGAQWVVDPSSQLGDRQLRKSVGRPDMLLQYVHYLRDAYQRDFGMDVAIYADAFASLNYRPEARIIDPQIDLAQESHTFLHAPWITNHPDSPLPSHQRRIDPALERSVAQIGEIARSQARVEEPLRIRPAP